MATIWIIALFLLGLLLIVKGGDYFVDAASWMAEVSGIPKFLIGATVVSIATTLPELFVSLIAVVQGKVDIASGNAIGSVTANTGLILGIAVICMPHIVSRKEFAAKGLILLFAAVILFAMTRNGTLDTLQCWILLGILALFVWENVREAKIHTANGRDTREKPARNVVLVNLAKFAAGAAGIVVGAQLLVDNGSELAYLIGVPEGVVGATIIAIGTSLPELVTMLTAVVKKQASLSVGNILGANIIDLTLIMPLCTLVSGQALPLSQQTVRLDLPFCLVTTIIAVFPALIFGKLRRGQGIALLAAYAVYLVFLFI